MVAIVFMVAGMSSRFGGIKQLCKVGPNDETLIEISVKQALSQSFSKIIFITNKKTEHLFKNLFNDNYLNAPVEYIQQTYDSNRTRPWGTTDAVCSLIGRINEPFILVNSDDIYGIDAFKQGYNYLITGKDNYIGTTTLKNTIKGDELVNRGILEINTSNNKVISLKEILGINPSKQHDLLNKLCNVNFMCLQPYIITLLKTKLDSFKLLHYNNNKIEALLPDDINDLIQNHNVIMYAFKIRDTIMSLTYQTDIPNMKKHLMK
tara:strand:- start:1333 stop:2121 length:789 start_codon:yes stop_codon:yes gene_type:complete